MSATIPTTAAIESGIVGEFESKFGITVPISNKSFLRVLSRVLAGLITTLYKYGGALVLNMFVKYASYEETTINGKKIVPLIEWGRAYGEPDPTAATRASYYVLVTVTTQTGTLANNTQLRNTSSGVIYLTVGAVALDAATKSVLVRANGDPDGNSGKGIQGNLTVGDELEFVSPTENVSRIATVTSEVDHAVDGETEAEYRARVYNRSRKRKQGGAAVDYEFWAKTVDGITSVYPYKGDPGIVQVYVAAAAETNGIPTASQLTAVEVAIELDDGGLASRRPISSFVVVNPIYRTAFTAVVNGLTVTDDQADVEDQIETAIEAYFASREPYVHGLTLDSRKDRITATAVASAAQDVVDAYNGIISSVTVAEGGDSIIVRALGMGEKASVSVSFT